MCLPESDMMNKPNPEKTTAQKIAEAAARLSTLPELLVVEGKADCPKCGRAVRVNQKYRQLYSHQRSDGKGSCPVWEEYRFTIISEYPYKFAKPVPPPSQKGQTKKARRPAGKSRKNHRLRNEYPEESGKSVKTIPRGYFR